MEIQMSTIGTVKQEGEGFVIQLEAGMAPALTGLEGFSHVYVLWWAHQLDSPEARQVRTVDKPYCKGPETLGIFATRSPVRPNPIALSTAQVLGVDVEQGQVYLAWIDAEPGTPVLDIKPYTPSADRVQNPQVPGWCGHWPSSLDTSADFDWEAEFNF